MKINVRFTVAFQFHAKKISTYIYCWQLFNIQHLSLVVFLLSMLKQPICIYYGLSVKSIHKMQQARNIIGKKTKRKIETITKSNKKLSFFCVLRQATQTCSIRNSFSFILVFTLCHYINEVWSWKLNHAFYFTVCFPFSRLSCATSTKKKHNIRAFSNRYS